ncbi:MAG: hypothetical protein OSB09_00745 [Planctomycetota bacterium]|nr:hypothetical protein [Planctomycetota bacterium]
MHTLPIRQVSAAVMLTLVVFIHSSLFGQNPNFLMHMDSADVLGGSTFTTTAKLDVLQPTEIQGWSFSLCSNPADLTPLSATLGVDTMTVKGGSPPDFDTTLLSADAVSNGVVICFTGCSSLSVTTNFELLNVNYQVEGSVGHTTSINYCTAGTPGVSTLVVIAGNSVPPVATGADFTVVSPNFMKFGNGTGIAAQSASMPVLVSTIRPLDGLSIAGAYDGALLSLSGVSASGIASGADFISTSANLASGEIAAGLIMAFNTSVDIPVGDDQEIMRIDFAVIGDLTGQMEPVISPVNFVPSAGNPPIQNLIVDGNYQETPNLVDGVITIVNFNPFVRGDCNSDGGLVNIADGIAVLQYLFQGGATPSCLDGCDLDDNGMIGVGDAVGVFNYQFAGGSPPAAPFPNAGIDPTTGDGIGCDGDADTQ